jgi:hypothetical protein
MTMKSMPEIQIQKLFLVALVLKVASAILGWYFKLTWSLGFVVPLVVMGAYIVLGLYRRNTDVTDEKFADTCYYLGFIFTITSIIFCLFDLPNIGTKMQDIAVRFGAAMVSTVLGLCVRVYLVSFRQDVGDALTNAENAVLDAARKFAEQLTIALERIRAFEAQVDDAAKTSVERVNLQVESLSKNHAEKLISFFAELTTQNQVAFTSALAEVKTASGQLAEAVDNYSQGMRSNLTSIEVKVGVFTEAVMSRLKTTTFPDDYFAKHLESPLGRLIDGTKGLAREVELVSSGVNQSSLILTDTLKQIRDKANATEDSLDTVLRLTVQQQSVLDTAQGQLTTMEQLAKTLASFDSALSGTLASISASNEVTSELTTRVSSVIEEGVSTRHSLEDSIMTVIRKLDANAAATSMVVSNLEANAEANMTAVATISEKLDSNSVAANNAAATIASHLEANINAAGTVATMLRTTAAASEMVAKKLDEVSAADVQASETLGVLGQHAFTAIGKVDLAVEQLQVMVRQLSALDAALQNQSVELKQVAEQIKNVKVVVEMPQYVAPYPLAGPLEAQSAEFSSPSPRTHDASPNAHLVDIEADEIRTTSTAGALLQNVVSRSSAA